MSEPDAERMAVAVERLARTVRSIVRHADSGLIQSDKEAKSHLMNIADNGREALRDLGMDVPAVNRG